VTSADFSRPGVWTQLLPSALALMTHLESQTHRPAWTFGGGTVLMLRIGHRQSKDIDLFVPDPQYLGFVNPRLSDVAEAISTDYEENAGFIKFFLPQGEIDIVVGTPLTDEPFDLVTHAGRQVRVETCAEIIARKFWHRGHHGKARDLFDLCAVAACEPQAIDKARPFMRRYGRAFLDALNARADIAQAEFEAIDALGFQTSFAEAMVIASAILAAP
jgi:hypothetical protein